MKHIRYLSSVLNINFVSPSDPEMLLRWVSVPVLRFKPLETLFKTQTNLEYGTSWWLSDKTLPSFTVQAPVSAIGGLRPSLAGLLYAEPGVLLRQNIDHAGRHITQKREEL